MASTTEAYVRSSMRLALRRQFQIIALRIIAEGGGTAEIALIRQVIRARHPEIRCDRRYPLKVLADNGIITISGTTVSFVEQLDPPQIADLLSALDERAVRTVGLRVEDASWRPDQPSGKCCGAGSLREPANAATSRAAIAPTSYHLGHIWRGSLLAAIGWSPAAINEPINLQLLCPVHHADKTGHEAQRLAADEAMTGPGTSHRPAPGAEDSTGDRTLLHEPHGRPSRSPEWGTSRRNPKRNIETRTISARQQWGLNG